MTASDFFLLLGASLGLLAAILGLIGVLILVAHWG